MPVTALQNVLDMHLVEGKKCRKNVLIMLVHSLPTNDQGNIKVHINNVRKTGPTDSTSQLPDKYEPDSTKKPVRLVVPVSYRTSTNRTVPIKNWTELSDSSQASAGA